MIYKSPTPISHAAAEKIFAEGNLDTIPSVLSSLALLDPDVQWVEQKCLMFAHHEHWMIREISAVCLGHLARIHQNIDLDRVIPVLIGLTKDSDVYVAGVAEDALDDIELFMGYRVPGRASAT